MCKTIGVPGSGSEPHVKSVVKDLVEVVSYNKSVSLGFICDKIGEAISRLQWLAWIPVSLAVKAKLIQSAVWPLALYSTDSTYIGQQHFTAVRKAAGKTLVGKWHNASNVIGCSSLSNFFLDPFLHTLLQCFRVLRRIATIMPQLAKDTVKTAVEWTGTNLLDLRPL